MPVLICAACSCCFPNCFDVHLGLPSGVHSARPRHSEALRSVLCQHLHSTRTPETTNRANGKDLFSFFIFFFPSSFVYPPMRTLQLTALADAKLPELGPEARVRLVQEARVHVELEQCDPCFYCPRRAISFVWRERPVLSPFTLLCLMCAQLHSAHSFLVYIDTQLPLNSQHQSQISELKADIAAIDEDSSSYGPREHAGKLQFKVTVEGDLFAFGSASSSCPDSVKRLMSLTVSSGALDGLLCLVFLRLFSLVLQFTFHCNRGDSSSGFNVNCKAAGNSRIFCRASFSSCLFCRSACEAALALFFRFLFLKPASRQAQPDLRRVRFRCGEAVARLGQYNASYSCFLFIC